jgi:hypothetical protein
MDLSFQMKFVDAAGNADSITLGYDITATDTLDSFFGETNIVSVAYKSGLDVRVGNKYYPSSPGQSPFQCKKQILFKKCPTSYPVPRAEINVVSKHSQ